MFDGALALIRQPDQDKSRWLVLWDQRTECFRFVTASRLERESFREAVDREVAWMLDLRRSRDYIVSSVPRLHIETEIPIAVSTESLLYRVQFFLVEIFGKTGRQILAADQRVYWADRDEIYTGETSDGRAIDPVWKEIVGRADVIPPT